MHKIRTKQKKKQFKRKKRIAFSNFIEQKKTSEKNV
jgi:hypothetical protein